MLIRRARVLIGGAVALGISLLVALPIASSASATTIPTFRPGPALYDVGISGGVSSAEVANAAAARAVTFTRFTARVRVGRRVFTYTMVGRNPAVRVRNASTTVRAELVPLIIRFPNGANWNPTRADSCDRGASPLARTQRSPIFVRQAWRFGRTRIGVGQVTDAYQRANFWRFARPRSTNPSYNVNLAATTRRAVTVNVPAADAAAATINCGNGQLAAVNVNFLQPVLQRIVNSLRGVNPSTLPIFVTHNVVEFVGNPSNCCILGFHSAFRRASGIQTYAIAMYDNSGAFRGVNDISALSHEVGEWMDDPYLNNATPAWGHIGQVSGCQSNLENGDPLSGTTFPVRHGGFTYHPQELAFFSWFYHQRPSIGVNGWYSDRGKFRRFAAACR